MVFRQALRKTGAYMVLSVVLGAAFSMFWAGTLEQPTGLATAEVLPGAASGPAWILFILGAFVGAILIGTYVWVAHLEAD